MLGKVPTMQTNSSIEPPDLGNPPGGGNMVDAYEPAWSALTKRRAGAGVLRQGDDGELAATRER